MLRVRCQNRDCEKLSNVDEETIFYQYCGHLFAGHGVNIPELAGLDELRRKAGSRFLCLVFALCVLSMIMIPVPLLVGWSDYDSIAYAYSILGFFVISVFVLTLIQDRRLKNRFPELYNQ